MNKIVLFALLLCTSSFAGWSQFVDVSSTQLNAEILNVSTIYGDGISFYDFNRDGQDDLSIASGREIPRFYINNNGQFEPIALNITNAQNKLVLMLLWADYDNDGDADLLITRDAAPIQLWRNNGNLVFENVAASAGLEQANYNYWGAAYADFNHDGCLDLFVAKYYNGYLNQGVQYRSLLYRSNCDGTFSEVTIAAGINLTPTPCFQPVFLDYNNDGWEDLFLAIDRMPFSNELFENNGDGTFTNVTIATGLNQYICSMSGTVGDYDNDLDDDIFIANGIAGNLLMKSDNGTTFNDVAPEYDIQINQICWGSMWIDYDNNSWQDLMVSITSPYLPPIGNQLFINQAGEGFLNGTAESGFGDDPTETHQVAMGDFNGDGYYDFVRSNRPPYPAQLYQNLGGTNHFVSVSLEGVFANRDGIGSRIHCYASGEHYIRYTHCGENFTSQNSEKKIFGIGESLVIDSLVVLWNSGTIDRFYNIPADTFLMIKEGDSYIQPFSIVPDGNLFLCEGESLLLDAGEYVSYNWSTGQNDRYITVSSPGIFNVVVTNVFGAEITSESIEVAFSQIELEQPMVQHVSCAGFANGEIAISNDQEYLSAITWSNGSDSTSILNLSPGVYTFEWTDIHSCEHDGAIEILEPEPLNVTASLNHATCFGANNASAALEIVGGNAPYAIDWFGQDSLALFAGLHSYSVIDNNSCFYSSEFVVVEPDEIIFQLNLSNVSCANGNDGMAQIEIVGGLPPYDVLWFGVDPTLLSAGEYNISVVDSLGCEISSVFSIEQPEILDCGLITSPQIGDDELGSAGVNVTGGTAPYHVAWSNGINELLTIDQLVSGEYSVVVTDENGCICTNDFSIDFVNVIVSNSLSQLVIFPVPADEFILVIGLPSTPGDVEIFDQSGKSIHLSKGIFYSHKIDTNQFPSGVYTARFTFDNHFLSMPLLILHD